MIPWGLTPLLSCRDLRFAWDGRRDVLVLPHFDVARGERVFVCGPSGSGKSTLLGLLAGVGVPREGRVVLLDTVLSGLSSAQRDRFRADHVGYVFQQFNLLPYLGLVDNVLLGCAFSARRTACAALHGTPRAEAERLLAALGLDAAPLRRRSVAALSVGQQQRVAAARALIGSPELVLADEPTSALDAEARDAFVALLLAECRRNGSAVVFVSHDLALARHFDRIVRLPAPARAEAA
ncbi:ATP-binding cassette domain-containing protein [Fulvimonas soli]|jgi:putative ABC transport system ATP-binding protein|uniref:Putative ABC transport system ATP-binding protein n=1 Tax=Fulvimonas soli TaxID=155197 RepID=A0A316II09_9GAMM|nr:ATP-binding cassette domain-containing protein [Fulvimonas soli]PWK93021.1 putative ABC transport system ATP-binding protein [Fulvimonas soli]TNY26404.1 methionine ABC transporter ATP-binding protein [Fulvimonas soli]